MRAGDNVSSPPSSSSFSQQQQQRKKGLLTVNDDHDDLDEDDYVTSYDMQEKLLAVWEMLSVSAFARMEYVCKYSTTAYSTELATAVDMLGAVAVYYVAMEFLYQLYKKLKVRSTSNR